MKHKKILIISIFIAFLVLLVLGIVLIYKINNKEESKEINLTFESRIKNIEESNIEKNEISGWIQVQGTNIDYPVTHNKFVRTIDDNDIEHTWEGDTITEGKNRRTIFGHNILNISSKPKIADPKHSRFEQLMSFVDYKFAKNNLYIQFTNDGEDEIYKIFAVGFFDSTLEQGLCYDKSMMAYFISSAQENSLYKYDIEVNEEDKIISLITCTRYFGLYKNTQFRVDARKLRENEKIEKYRVEKTKKYDIIK